MMKQIVGEDDHFWTMGRDGMVLWLPTVRWDVFQDILRVSTSRDTLCTQAFGFPTDFDI
jgi:hypothetical protein